MFHILGMTGQHYSLPLSPTDTCSHLINKGASLKVYIIDCKEREKGWGESNSKQIIRAKGSIWIT
jgi:hypothetical protein